MRLSGVNADCYNVDMHTWLKCGSISLGQKAWETCLLQSGARVMGVTSRGLFLLTPPQRILFVSVEHVRSPLTITLDRACDQLRRLEIGAAARFSGTRLVFPTIELSVSLSADAMWQCPLPAAAPRPRAEQTRVLQSIAQAVLARRGYVGLAALLPALLDRPEAASLSTEHAAILDQLIALRCTVQMGGSRRIIDGLTSLLGQGRGLTPSGDDMVMGFLLMLNRWRTDYDSLALNQAVIEAAYQCTTTISANLIECAADGQGDERLIAVADGIATGTASIDECAEFILDWGSSSGIDALAGMALAITSQG